MKNRLIYLLISLMVVAIIGIITLQGVWITDAINERERDFSAHVNDALNRVNDAIDDDEAVFFLENKFGGVDSLLHDIVIIEDGDSSEAQQDFIVVNDNSQPHNRVKIKYHTTMDSLGESLENLEADMSEFEELHENFNEWSEKLELKMEQVDSVLETTIHLEHAKDHKLEHITSIVEHFTFEKMLSGELEDRISKDGLQEKLKTALKKEGVDTEFEFAVFNKETEKYEDSFATAAFDKNYGGDPFKKLLFQNDRVTESNFELNVQFANSSGYIWSKVSSMVLLSVLFSALILLCFGYSLYFIFKQKKISQVKNDFINNMTHELKTPLASISLAASSIKHPEVINKPDEINYFVDIIENEERRINTHIEQVLDIAALDKGEIQLNFVETDLIDILKASMKNVNLSLSESNGTSTFEHSVTEAPFNGDVFHLTNVFSNILDNSIKYRKENLQINVLLEVKDGNYTITIRDNGIGMNGKTQKLAFDKFFRAETGNIHNIKGFGLGLSYVKSIVVAHSGTVELSGEIDQGTTVIINLPAKR